MTRAAMQDVLQSDFVRTARAKGLLEGRVVIRHAFRNALMSVVMVLGLDFGSYLTGSILSETISPGRASGATCSPPSTSVTSP
jgi:ABC-type dipeptide/oligopeptide/nickel transport system permease component